MAEVSASSLSRSSSHPSLGVSLVAIVHGGSFCIFPFSDLLASEFRCYVTSVSGGCPQRKFPHLNILRSLVLWWVPNLAIVSNGNSFPREVRILKSRRSPNSASSGKYIAHFLKSCKSITQIHQIHARIIKNGHEQDPFVVFELLRASATTSFINYAAKIFATLEAPNVFHYTALIDGYVLSESYEDGIRLYCRMIEESIVPDKYVIASALKACALNMSLGEGKRIHAQVLKLGLSRDRIVGIRLVELYGKCGEFVYAWKLFDEIPKRDAVVQTVIMSSYFDRGRTAEAKLVFSGIDEKDTVCWTAMIDGLVRNGEMNMALDIFREMQRQNVRPNAVTIVCIVSACSQLGALELGQWVHSYMRKFEINLNPFVGGALINMYSRCGDIEEALSVFTEMKEKDVSTYNAMISGLALHGRSSDAIKMFETMRSNRIRPNAVTFVSLLNACSHGGLVEFGYKLFNSMKEEYGVDPKLEHYGCMVDLLGRVGRVEEAYDFMKNMNIPPDDIMLGSLLSACKLHGNFTLAEQVANLLLSYDIADSGTIILLANTYSSFGRWKEAAQLRAAMKQSGVVKEPGCSSIEVKGVIHEFILGDTSHPERKQIYQRLEKLNELLRLEGYLPSTEGVLHDLEDGEKESALAIHSERLAISYGLISTEPGSTIRVAKNLRVCNDCHEMIKVVSKVTQRKIVVRDRKRFHHFENGACSCGDYW